MCRSLLCDLNGGRTTEWPSAISNTTEREWVRGAGEVGGGSPAAGRAEATVPGGTNLHPDAFPPPKPHPVCHTFIPIRASVTGSEASGSFGDLRVDLLAPLAWGRAPGKQHSWAVTGHFPHGQLPARNPPGWSPCQGGGARAHPAQQVPRLPPGNSAALPTPSFPWWGQRSVMG